MKRTIINLGLLLAIFASSSHLTACKKDKPSTVNEPSVTTVDTAPTAAEPVEIASDSELTATVEDAVKDFPGVVATVNAGEITLTGEITRDRLPALMQSLHALEPKKINNNLTVQK